MLGVGEALVRFQHSARVALRRPPVPTSVNLGFKVPQQNQHVRQTTARINRHPTVSIEGYFVDSELKRLPHGRQRLLPPLVVAIKAV
jgi:hypothetical protein